MNNECPTNRACVRNKCVDPCPGVCGQSAMCNVFNHVPMCSCPSGMTGSAFVLCSPAQGSLDPRNKPRDPYIERDNHYTNFQPLLVTTISDPCNPSPCGPNSQCRQNNMQAVCSCINGYIGAPPTCRPECVVSSDCPLNEACTNQRCGDPCPGSCGRNAACSVVNHNPVCICKERMTGDPFVNCYPMRKNPSDDIPESTTFSIVTFGTSILMIPT